MPRIVSADEAFLVERGHDDRDPLALEHQDEAGAAAPRRRAAMGSTTSAAIAPTMSPIKRPDEERRPARAGRRLARGRGLDDPARLDALGEVEELARLRGVVLDGGPARVGSGDHGVEVRRDEQPLLQRDRAVGDDRGLLRLCRADARVHLRELSLARLHLLLEKRDLLRHVDGDTLGDAVGERGRSQLDLALARALDRDLHERVDAA